jgi:threonine dehydrogenase-like Zn-dependent dehydrogenase
MYAAGDVRVENVPDATLVEPTDAILRMSRACTCGSDLWPYRAMERTQAGQSWGHEAMGIVQAVGRAVGARVRAAMGSPYPEQGCGPTLRPGATGCLII